MYTNYGDPSGREEECEPVTRYMTTSYIDGRYWTRTSDPLLVRHHNHETLDGLGARRWLPGIILRRLLESGTFALQGCLADVSIRPGGTLLGL